MDDLLDVSEIVVGRRQLERRPVDVADVVRAAIERVAPEAEARGIVMELTCAPLALVLGDADRLRQVMANLLGSAVMVAPAGGRVDVALAVEGERVHVQVRDAAGADTLAHGGRGLAIARYLVELHGGAVHAEPGASRIVELPLLDGAHPVAARAG
jgi:hypothetical protein